MMGETLSKNKNIICSILDIDEKTFSAICGDILKRSDAGTKTKLLKLVSRPIVLLGIAVASKLLTIGAKHRYQEDSNDDFVFVSCVDPIHRIRSLEKVAEGFDYSLIFIPSYRFGELKNYVRYYKNRCQKKVYYNTFSINDVFRYAVSLPKINRQINRLSCESNEDKQFLSIYIKRFLLYSLYAKRAFGKIGATKKKWIFEHDKFFFIPVINEFRRHGVYTTQMQHGNFFYSETAPFIPLFTDRVLCCSEREKNLYVRSGESPKNVFPLGAPLQTIRDSIPSGEEHYDLLVLLTATNVKEWYESQHSVLRYLAGRADINILLRFRPRSSEEDKTRLNIDASKFQVSHGRDLSKDICESKRVLSFSTDAVYEVMAANKPFVVIDSAAKNLDEKSRKIFYLPEEIDVAIENLIENTDNNSEYNRYVFGETNVATIKKRFAWCMNNFC